MNATLKRCIGYPRTKCERAAHVGIWIFGVAPFICATVVAVITAVLGLYVLARDVHPWLGYAVGLGPFAAMVVALLVHMIRWIRKGDPC